MRGYCRSKICSLMTTNYILRNLLINRLSSFLGSFGKTFSKSLLCMAIRSFQNFLLPNAMKSIITKNCRKQIQRNMVIINWSFHQRFFLLMRSSYCLELKLYCYEVFHFMYRSFLAMWSVC